MTHGPRPADLIRHTDPSDVADGIDRRGFLKCMAWAGSGVVFAMRGGVLASTRIGQGQPPQAALANADFTFVQISDSHIGFASAPNKDVAATLQRAVDRINALPKPPD